MTETTTVSSWGGQDTDDVRDNPLVLEFAGEVADAAVAAVTAEYEAELQEAKLHTEPIGWGKSRRENMLWFGAGVAGVLGVEVIALLIATAVIL